jgi:hypothetical protein
MPTPPKATLTDPELLLQLEEGRSLSKIATSAGVTRQALSERLKRLRENIPAPAARRAEETVSLALGAFEALSGSIATLQKLQSACERLLAGADGTFDVGPHDFDLEVTVLGDRGQPIRRPIRDLLQGAGTLISIEGKFADPRTLLVSVLRELRAHIETGVKLAERLHQVQEVERFMSEVLDAIAAADPATAARVRGALHERRALRLALSPPGPDSGQRSVLHPLPE